MYSPLLSRGRWLQLLIVCAIAIGAWSPAKPAAAGPSATATVRIIAVDESGVRVKGACFQGIRGLFLPWTCDADNASGLNGAVVLSVAPGYYLIGFLRVPPGYANPGTKDVTMLDGQEDTIRFVLKRGASTLKVSTIDKISRQPITGFCYRVGLEVYDPHPYRACDDDDGVVDGVIRFGGLQNATFDVSVGSVNTTYYPVFGIKQTTFTSVGTTKSLTWTMEKAPASAKIRVRVVTNRWMTPVKGACFTLTISGYSWWRCDEADGANDGVTTYFPARPGNHQIDLGTERVLGVYDVPAQNITKVDGEVLTVTINVWRIPSP